MIKPTEKWAYSFSGLEYNSPMYNSFEEALTDGTNEAKNEGYNKVYVGRVMKFVPKVRADNIIEVLQQDAYDEADEYSLDYLENVSLKDIRKLEAMLTETFNKWAKETNNEPSFYTIEETSEHSI